MDPGSATVPVAAGRVSRPALGVDYSCQQADWQVLDLRIRLRKSVFGVTPNTAVETTVLPGIAQPLTPAENVEEASY